MGHIHTFKNTFAYLRSFKNLLHAPANRVKKPVYDSKPETIRSQMYVNMSPFKSARHDPQHHPLNFFQTQCDFGTKSLVIFF